MKHFRVFRSKGLCRIAPISLCCILAWLANPVSRVQAQTYGVLREVFADIGGVNVADLTNAPAYPSSPTSTNFVTDLFESPTDILENTARGCMGI